MANPDQRRRFSLMKLCEIARRHTREITVIKLCDAYDQFCCYLNPDYCARNNVEVATTLPDFMHEMLNQVTTTCRHEEHTMAFVERVTKTFPVTVTEFPRNPVTTPEKNSVTDPVTKKARGSRGPKASGKALTAAERMRKMRKDRADQALREAEQKK